MSASQNEALVQAICTELATAVATLLGLSSSVTSGGQPPSSGWHIRFGIGGHGNGSVWLGLSESDAAVITRRILGVEYEEPAEGTLRDTLRELAAQTGAGVQSSPAFRGLEFHVDSLDKSFQGVPGSRPTVWTLQLGEDLTIVVAAWSAVTLGEPLTSQTRPLPPGSENLSMILDIDLPMAVRFGRTELALGALTRLGPGSIIDLGRSPDDPVEVLVSGRVVAHGDVVVVGGNYGVRITDVVNVARPQAD